MITVQRELYMESPREGLAVILGAGYVGTGLRRRESLCYECDGRDDLPFEPQERFSEDNGRTWSPWEPLPDVVSFEEGRADLWGGGSVYQDPETGGHLGIWLRQTIVDEPPRRWYNHSYWAVSEDDGKSWGEPVQFRYEEGANRDPSRPLDPAFLRNNQAYPGGLIRHSTGGLVFCATAINIPKEAPQTDPTGEHVGWDKGPHPRDIGAACFVGRWDDAKRTCNWQISNRVWLPVSASSRGLQEAMPAELSDGRVLIVYRGSNTAVTPGHKWFSLSDDGGLTLSEVQELRYDDGTQFYSPSSIHGFLRHSVSGTLYWLANICAELPDGNSPRYPLIIAEVEETIPAIKRNTVTVVDDRQPGEGKALSLSNFSVFENRETHHLELYMSRYAAKVDSYAEDPRAYYEADCYKYTLCFE